MGNYHVRFYQGGIAHHGYLLIALKGDMKITPIQPQSVARNPSLAKQLFGYAISGFALTEAIASFAPMMAFLILFVF